MHVLRLSALLLLLLQLGLGAEEAAPPPPAVFTVTEPGGTTFEYRLTFLRDTPKHAVYQISYPSPVHTDLESNNTIPGEYYLPHGIQPGDPQRPAVVCLHILGGNFELVRLLCAVFADRGIPAIMFKLPYYGERADRGAYRLLQTDANVFTQALQQTTADIERTMHLLASRPEVNPDRIGISGISLGAIVGATACGKLPNVWRAGLILGGADLDTILHHARETRALSQFIQAQLPAERERIERVIAELDPARYPDRLQAMGQAGRILMVNATNDEVIPRSCTDKLATAAGVTDQVVWLDGLAHYTAMAALPSIVQQLGDFFAQDLPPGIAPPPEPEAAVLPPEHRLARFVRELLALIGPSPAAGHCLLAKLQGEVRDPKGKVQGGQLELVRGEAEQFRLACRLPKVGGLALGNGDAPWLQSDQGRCFVGEIGDANGRALASYLNPQLLLKARVVWGALSAMTVSPNAFRDYLTVTVRKTEDGRDILDIDLHHRHAKGRGELLFAADGVTPDALSFTAPDGLTGTIRFQQWQPDTVAPNGLFQAPATDTKPVPREDLYRMFAAVFAFAGESVQ